MSDPRDDTPTRFCSWFLLAGDALAVGWRPQNPAAGPNARLANAMMATLPDLRRLPADGDTRIRLAMAATLLGRVLPRQRHAAEQAVRAWRGPGVGDPGRMIDADAMAGRVLLAVLARDEDDAVRTLDALFRTSYPHTGSLQDLVLARLDDAGWVRELACLQQVAFSVRDEPMLRALVSIGTAGPALAPRKRTRPTHTPCPVPRDWSSTMMMVV